MAKKGFLNVFQEGLKASPRTLEGVRNGLKLADIFSEDQIVDLLNGKSQNFTVKQMGRLVTVLSTCYESKKGTEEGTKQLEHQRYNKELYANEQTTDWWLDWRFRLAESATSIITGIDELDEFETSSNGNKEALRSDIEKLLIQAVHFDELFIIRKLLLQRLKERTNEPVEELAATEIKGLLEQHDLNIPDQIVELISLGRKSYKKWSVKQIQSVVENLAPYTDHIITTKHENWTENLINTLLVLNEKIELVCGVADANELGKALSNRASEEDKKEKIAELRFKIEEKLREIAERTAWAELSQLVRYLVIEVADRLRKEFNGDRKKLGVPKTATDTMYDYKGGKKINNFTAENIAKLMLVLINPIKFQRADWKQLAHKFIDCVINAAIVSDASPDDLRIRLEELLSETESFLDIHSHIDDQTQDVLDRLREKIEALADKRFIHFLAPVYIDRIVNATAGSKKHRGERFSNIHSNCGGSALFLAKDFKRLGIIERSYLYSIYGRDELAELLDKSGVWYSEDQETGSGYLMNCCKIVEGKSAETIHIPYWRGPNIFEEHVTTVQEKDIVTSRNVLRNFTFSHIEPTLGKNLSSKGGVLYIAGYLRSSLSEDLLDKLQAFQRSSVFTVLEMGFQRMDDTSHQKFLNLHQAFRNRLLDLLVTSVSELGQFITVILFKKLRDTEIDAKQFGEALKFLSNNKTNNYLEGLLQLCIKNKIYLPDLTLIRDSEFAYGHVHLFVAHHHQMTEAKSAQYRYSMVGHRNIPVSSFLNELLWGERIFEIELNESQKIVKKLKGSLKQASEAWVNSVPGANL